VPTIQLYHHQSQLRSTSGPRANPNVFGAAQAQALGAVSAQIGEIGQKLQDTADYRAITEYQLEEQDFAAKQEKWLLDNPHAEKDEILKRYRVEREAFNQSQLKKKHLSKRAKEQIGFMTQAATKKGDLATTQVARTREIKRANEVSDIVTQGAIQRGDLPAAIAQLDRDIELGIKPPEIREHTIQLWETQIQQISLNRELAQTLDLPPAEAKARLNEIITSLQQGSEETAELGLKQINDGLTSAEHLRRKQDQDINKTAQNAINAIATGQADETLLHDLYEQGQIDKDTFDRLSLSSIKQAQQKANQQKALKQANAFDSLSKGITPSKDKPPYVGVSEIELARRLGEITEPQAKQLHAILDNQALFERNQEDGTYKVLMEEIKSQFIETEDTKKRLQKAPKTIGDIQETATKIAKSGLSIPNILKLQDAYLAVHQSQLDAINQLERKKRWPRADLPDTRDAREAELRFAIKEQIIASPRLREKALALKTYLAHEAEVRELFSQGAPSEQQIETFKANTLRAIKYAESAAFVKETYGINHDYAFEDKE